MSLGYSDTPLIPGTTFHVHDGERMQPPVIDPGNFGSPPSDAFVLFHGGDMMLWKSHDGNACPWKLEHGYMEVAPGTGDITSTESFGDMQLHLEFCTPHEVKGSSQGRGNSGVFIQDRYEIQVLDNWDNPTYADGTVGAIYGQYPPLVNPARRPGEWQAYDIFWKAPRWKGKSAKPASPAIATIMYNGICIHHAVALNGPTGHRNVPEWEPHGDAPIRLQDHGDLVRYRNIWVRRIKAYDE